MLEYDPADAAAMYELANIYTDQGKSRKHCLLLKKRLQPIL